MTERTGVDTETRNGRRDSRACGEGRGWRKSHQAILEQLLLQWASTVIFSSALEASLLSDLDIG